MVSHKMSLVALADKTLVLADGRMRAFGPTRDVLQPKPAVAAAPAQIENARNIA